LRHHWVSAFGVLTVTEPSVTYPARLIVADGGYEARARSFTELRMLVIWLVSTCTPGGTMMSTDDSTTPRTTRVWSANAAVLKSNTADAMNRLTSRCRGTCHSPRRFVEHMTPPTRPCAATGGGGVPGT